MEKVKLRERSELNMEVQTKNADEQKPFVKLLLSVLRVLLILGLLIYVLYHFTNGFSAEMRTETVKVYSEDIVLKAQGVIVRDETPVGGSASGVISYRFADGERVSKGASVATVYSGGDAKTIARASEIDKTVEFLEAISEEGEIGVIEGIAASKDISAMLIEATGKIARGNYGEALSDRDELVRAFIISKGALENEVGAEKQIEVLKKERETLARSLSGNPYSVKADNAGYFYGHSDGAEKIFDYDRIMSITPEEYKKGVEAALTASSSSVGKTVTLPLWYFVCSDTKVACQGLSEGKKYSILFESDDIRIEMLLEAKNTVGDETVLVFSSKEMPQNFDFERSQKVSIVKETVSGYRVPSSSLRVVDGTMGVYIRSGNTVKFRAADVIYESGAYSFVSTKTAGITLFEADDNPDNDIYCKGLSLYDNVIISGAKELSPDRIVN